jgi:hypothetical protein
MAYFDSMNSYMLTVQERKDVKDYILDLRGGRNTQNQRFRERAIKQFFALKFLVEKATKQVEALHAFLLFLLNATRRAIPLSKYSF